MGRWGEGGRRRADARGLGGHVPSAEGGSTTHVWGLPGRLCKADHRCPRCSCQSPSRAARSAWCQEFLRALHERRRGCVPATRCVCGSGRPVCMRPGPGHTGPLPAPTEVRSPSCRHRVRLPTDQRSAPLPSLPRVPEGGGEDDRLVNSGD